MKLSHKALLGTLFAVSFPASAEPAATAGAAPAAPYTFLDSVHSGKHLTSFRLRYEWVESDAPVHTRNANAWTLRSLVGWQTAPWHNFSIAAQAIDVSALQEDYDNRDKGRAEPGKGAYPPVVDPDLTDINQLFVEWTGIRNTKVRLGRQSVKLDNVRMVGNVEFRQVMQVFDGIALENKGLLPKISLYLAHYTGLRQVNTQYQSANVEMVNVRYGLSPSENLVGYAYLIDWNDAPLTTTSSKTFGLRADGARILNPDWRVLYTAEYAKQDDYKDGNSNIDSHYLRLGGGAQYGTWYLRLDHEILSSNDRLSAFQTPLGTNHLFQGWADLFLTTPNAGIQDTFLSFGGKLWGVQLVGEYHIIKSDEDFRTTGDPLGAFSGDTYGKELNLAATYSYGKNWLARVEYASFKEDDPLVGARRFDTDKLWIMGMYTF